MGVGQQKNTNLIMKGVKYLNNIFCNKHPDERLNMVCIHKACPNRGLLCQLCRGDEAEVHYLHPDELLPFKYFLESLEANLDEKEGEFSAVVEHSCLSRLQKLRDEMLGRLAVTVQELARLVGELQLRIINDFEAGKEQVRQKALVFRQYKHCIDRCIIHNIRKEEKFELISEIRKIVQHVKPIQGKNSTYKYHLDLTGKPIIADFIEKSERLKIDCERLDLDFKNIFGNNRERQNARTLQKYQEQMLKKELHSIEAENKGLLQAKRKAEQLKVSKLEDEKLEKRKDQKQKKKEKKKEQQDKKAKKEKASEIKKEKQSLLQKMNLLLPTEIKQNIIDFVPKEGIEATTFKKQPKISFAQFAENEMKMQQLANNKNSKSAIFSSLFKGISLKITKTGRVAKQTVQDEKASGFVVVSEALDKCKKIAMKVIKVKGQVFLGIARHQVIAANKYAFNMNAEGHGAYMISSKGMAFSSTCPQDNKHQKLFSFEDGDIVNLIYEKPTLYFERMPNKKSMGEPQEALLSIEINAADAKHYNFCVFLSGNGDSVQLI